jgi:hypothetical protein
VALFAAVSGVIYGIRDTLRDTIALLETASRVSSPLTYLRLVRNPSLLVEAVISVARTTKRLVDDPGSVERIPGALIGPVAAAQQAQNPFPNSALLHPENLRSDALNVLFAAGWFAGAAVGLIAGELALSVVGGGAAGALSQFSRVARVFNAARGIRVLVKESLTRLTRWTLQRTSTGLRVLDSSVITPALSRIPTGRQATVLKQLNEVPDSKKRLVADRGREEALVSYLRRTGVRGRQLVERLPDPVSERLITLGDEFKQGAEVQRRLAEAVFDRSTGVGLSDAGSVTNTFRGLDADGRETFSRAADGYGAEGLKAVSDGGDAFLQRYDEFADAGNFDSLDDVESRDGRSAFGITVEGDGDGLKRLTPSGTDVEKLTIGRTRTSSTPRTAMPSLERRLTRPSRRVESIY